jgi:hypothetical protein
MRRLVSRSLSLADLVATPAGYTQIAQLSRRCYPGVTLPKIGEFRVSAKPLIYLGAGEGIRTLDPNLGKVVLYP